MERQTLPEHKAAVTPGLATKVWETNTRAEVAGVAAAALELAKAKERKGEE